MNSNIDIMGDRIEITKGKKGEYFRYYIRRYQGELCTLIAGCSDEKETIKKVSGLVNGTYYEELSNKE